MERRRSALARVGISALNLLAPGLGVLRLGRARQGALLLFTPTLLLLLSAVTFSLAPLPSFTGAVIFVAVMLSLQLLALVLAVGLSWRFSAERVPHSPWWSRWYGLLVAWLLVSVTSSLAVAACHRFYKPFYMPAESMAPTLAMNDKILGDMRGGRTPAIGDLVLLDTPRGIYVKRVAAREGDRVSMRNGVPIVNGRAAISLPAGETSFVGYEGAARALQRRERLPGEAGSHLVLDTGPSDVDNMEERVVPGASIFVLGDNRDRSADSRVPPDLGGTGMVDPDRIIGRPLFVHWSSDRAKIGRSATR